MMTRTQAIQAGAVDLKKDGDLWIEQKDGGKLLVVESAPTRTKREAIRIGAEAKNPVQAVIR